MTSLVYKTEMFFVRHFGPRRIFGLNEVRLRTWLERRAKRRKHEVPRSIRRNFTVHDASVAGYFCPIIESCDDRRKKRVADRSVTADTANVKKPAPLVLFIHGGGMIYEAMPLHWRIARHLIDKTGARIAFLDYPLLPEASVYESTDAVVAAFKAFMDGSLDGTPHDPQAITILGDSAGAMLALTAMAALRDQDIQARRLILVSPVQAVIDSPDIRAQVDALSAGDDILQSSLLDVLFAMMPLRPERDPFIIRPLEGDYRGFPPTSIFIGTSEIFYPLMPKFLAYLKRDGIDYDYHVGEGLCHTWPYNPAVDCRAGLDLIVDIIQR